TVALAALRAVAGVRVWVAGIGLAAAAASVGCNNYGSGPFDPRALENAERRAARGEVTPVPDNYPTTREAIPVPQGPINGGARLVGRETIATMPTTGRSFPAADTVPMSLRDAIGRAVLYNAEVRVAGYEPAINAARVVEQRAAFDPALIMNFSAQRNDTGLSTNPKIGVNTLTGFTDKTYTHLGEIGVQQTLETGTKWSATWGETWNRIEAGGLSNSANSKFWQNQIRLQIQQPLLRDFGREVNTARIEIARGDQRISVLDFRNKLEEQLTGVEQAYWQLLQAVRTVEIQEALLIDTLETYRVLYFRWVGKLDASEIPVSQAQSSVEQRRADLIEAKRIVRDLSDELKRRMGDPSFPVNSPLVILPSDEPLRDPVAFDLDAMIDAAVANRAELGQQILRIEQARVAEYVAVNNKLPQLNFTGDLRFIGLGEDASESIKHGGDLNSPTWNFGFEFSYPIGNRAAQAIFLRARLQRQQAIEQYRALLLQVQLDVKQAINDVYSQWSQVIARKKAREASARQLALIQRQQDLG
ncbi:MAG TPA: TolC family protein, partial [Humisphaera sp.]